MLYFVILFFVNKYITYFYMTLVYLVPILCFLQIFRYVEHVTLEGIGRYFAADRVVRLHPALFVILSLLNYNLKSIVNV